MNKPESKYYGRDKAAARIREWQQAGKTVVFTNGCFDLIHAGHVTYLREAAALGDVLVVALNSDASIQRLKGKSRPLVSLPDRVTVMAAFEMVDMVVSFEEDTPVPLLSVLKPDVHVKGGDYKKETLPEYSVVTGYGGRVEILGFVAGLSTSTIVERIRQSMMTEAP